jgi:hypothetical protein
MYYRRPGFGLFPLPYPLLPIFCQEVASLSRSSCVSPVELTNGGVVRVVGRSIVLFNPLHTLWMILYASKGPLFGVRIFAIDILLVLKTHTAVTLKQTE